MKKILLISAFLFSIHSEVKASSAWNQKTHFGGVARHRGTGMAIGNKGYMGLGHYNGSGFNYIKSDWWEYDPSSNTWCQKADYPFPTYAASWFTIGSKGYVGAGVSAGNLFYSYDPITNIWAPISSVPIGATDQVGFSVNGKGYFIYSNYLYEYDPILDVWNTKANAPFSSWSWSSAFDINGKAYVKSGNEFWEYNSVLDTWTPKAIFPGVATGGSASFVVNGKGYIVCGGYIGWLSELTTEVWEYDPTLDVWTAMQEFPAMARRFTNGFSIGNKGYVGIGTNGTNFRDFWEFDEILAVPKNSNSVLISEPFPNPSTDQINFTIQSNTISSSNIQVKVFDLNGREIYTELFQQSTLQISKDEIGSGVYIYQILAGNERIKTGKIIFE